MLNWPSKVFLHLDISSLRKEIEPMCLALLCIKSFPCVISLQTDLNLNTVCKTDRSQPDNLRIIAPVQPNTGISLLNAWCVFRNKHTRTRACENCSFAITNVCCKVLVFSSAGIAGYRSINCVAVLNWLAFVTVLVLTIIEQYEYSDSLKDQTRLKTVKSGRRPLFVRKICS